MEQYSGKAKDTSRPESLEKSLSQKSSDISNKEKGKIRLARAGLETLFKFSAADKAPKHKQ